MNLEGFDKLQRVTAYLRRFEDEADLKKIYSGTYTPRRDEELSVREMFRALSTIQLKMIQDACRAITEKRGAD